ncbi:hypothetical protein FGG08_005753 [Glutinoglossum americanum]|uniref:alpha-1,2-Mannosidase n=1 Tax=Glutinoglossum americanum TaxID=1670608 RepID=A0A9P8L140_9PEZI|nr:hypothetical protein FGG08_005753 [Glutinoglossum americanum]
MLRLRRYRTFLIFAIFTTFILYHFRSIQWTPDAPLHTENPSDQGDAVVHTPNEITKEIRPNVAVVPAAESTEERIPPPSIPPISKPTQKIAQPTQPPVEKPLDETPPTNPNTQNAYVDDHSQSAQYVAPVPTSTSTSTSTSTTSTVIHWTKLPEHFPIPTESLIQLPTGTPKAIPKIQHVFSDESYHARTERERKQAAIKQQFKKAWVGYKEHAWLQDELSPITGDFRNPFCGWAATLVDSLDTLWIMGFEDEFKEALDALKTIDFTTSIRQDVPVFETTIRYLGGLLGAYDVSGGKYSILVKKAVELAEVLMGAFDTPNRMPVAYYYWKPAFASQPHRAPTRVVLAELGSLLLEFTRLAQITREPKYFDAVQRITDELEKYQDKTKLPGLWPTFIDASGCVTQQPPIPKIDNTEQAVISPPTDEGREDEIREGQKLSKDLANEVGAIDVNGLPKIPPDTKETQQDLPPNSNQEIFAKPPPIMLDGKPGVGGTDAPANTGKTEGHGLGWESSGKERPQRAKRQPDINGHCVPQGLASPPFSAVDSFTLGGMADSVYEYFPKEFMLLGGQEQYRRLYEKAIDVAKQYIFFRPMTPTGRDILISGSITASDQGLGDLYPHGEHLGCFIGGMLAIGAKIFEREEDLVVGAKLADGCVWSYESTTSGIMPEGFNLIPCDAKDCTWNETKWFESLTPDYVEPSPPPPPLPKKPIANATEASEATTSVPLDSDEAEPQIDTPAPRTRKEIATERIIESRLPPGFQSIHSPGYILRPEAIESVFILYRITGDSSWQTKGWKMFQAIMNATSAEFGNSAIADVTAGSPRQINEMESFFLAETMKYFYLLFSEPGVISLDDYVLNTEAHPFKRPK